MKIGLESNKHYSLIYKKEFMKSLVKVILYLLGFLVAKVFNVKWAHKFKMLHRYLYTYWVIQNFKRTGRNVIIGSFQYLREPDKIVLGDNVAIGQHCIFELYSSYGDQRFTPFLSLGNNSSIGDYSHITCINRICIGNNVLMGRKVFITDNAHGASDYKLMGVPPNLRPLYSKGPVIIEDNVWIGEMVCIMPGVTIGKCSIIGANAVVTKDIPPYSVVVGPNATIKKTIKK